MYLRTIQSQGAIEHYKLSSNLEGKLGRGISVSEDMIFDEIMKFRKIKRNLRKWKFQIKLLEIKIRDEIREQGEDVVKLRTEKRKLRLQCKLEKEAYKFHRIKRKKLK